MGLKKYGELLYDHLIIFAPTVEEFGGAISPEAITEFIDEGGNVLVAGNSNLGEALREVASEVGLSRLSTADQISVIPLRHDKYERFIGQAYPYYASAFSMMAGVFVFSLVFLHYKEEDVVKKTQ